MTKYVRNEPVPTPPTRASRAQTVYIMHEFTRQAQLSADIQNQTDIMLGMDMNGHGAPYNTACLFSAAGEETNNWCQLVSAINHFPRANKDLAVPYSISSPCMRCFNNINPEREVLPICSNINMELLANIRVVELWCFHYALSVQ